MVSAWTPGPTCLIFRGVGEAFIKQVQWFGRRRDPSGRKRVARKAARVACSPLHDGPFRPFDARRHSMGMALALLIVLPLVGSGCGGSRRGSVRITDVTKTNSIPLTSGWSGIGGNLPSGITLHLRGRIDGSARVWAGNWETTRLSGTVAWRVYHDWYETNCVLHYLPESVKSGELTVDYRFH